MDPNIDMKTPPVEQLQKMSSASFLGALARLLRSNPPPDSDAPVLTKLAAIGVVPGEGFDPAKLDPAVVRGLDKALPIALQKLQEGAQQSGTPVNGWQIPPMILGNFGAEYGPPGDRRFGRAGR